MTTMRNWMLAAAMVIAGLGAGATVAQAAEFRIYVRGPVAYVPPCPGPGYFWVPGYYADGYWMPGRWEFRDMRDRGAFARFEWRRDHDRHFDRYRGWDRGWDRDRHFDRDRDRDRDHFRR